MAIFLENLKKKLWKTYFDILPESAMITCMITGNAFSNILFADKDVTK